MTDSADSAKQWTSRWREGRTGWDLRGPHARLRRIVEEARSWNLLPDGAKILEPGCGHAHNGAALAGMGYKVTSFDMVEEAIQAARTLYGQVENLELGIGDALAVREEWKGRFQAVFDRAMLCALEPEQRPLYVATCFAHLEPGGVLMSLPFLETNLPDGRLGPPFAISMDELTRLLTPGFALVTAEEFPDADGGGNVVREMLCLWRRRKRWLVEST